MSDLPDLSAFLAPFDASIEELTQDGQIPDRLRAVIETRLAGWRVREAQAADLEAGIVAAGDTDGLAAKARAARLYARSMVAELEKRLPPAAPADAGLA